ncbi:MAG: hypothetical protein FWD08_00220 [Alphaproteobacteria bacterium]|nr:hypothetical protein [Alphaproteobacteria bacterium]
MRIPKGCDVRLETNNGVELHVEAVLTTKSQATELIKAIRQLAGALDPEKRTGRPAAKLKVAE